MRSDVPEVDKNEDELAEGPVVGPTMVRPLLWAVAVPLLEAMLILKEDV